jgi:predicted nucleotidyltransferase
MRSAGWVSIEPIGPISRCHQEYIARSHQHRISHQYRILHTIQLTQIPQSEFQEPTRTLVTRLTDQLDEIQGIVLFGSVARGAADRQSDIDCFVLVEEEQALAQQTAHELTSHLREERFRGDRYTFHVLVESVANARKHGERLQEIFAEGLTLEDTSALRQLKTEVLTDGR